MTDLINFFTGSSMVKVAGNEREPIFLQTQRLFMNKLLTTRIHCGQSLKESVLAREFGVGRVAMREVLCQAIGWGIVEYVPFRGYQVRDFTLREIADRLELRLCVEPRAARLLAESRHPGTLAELRKIHQREIDAITAGDMAGFGAANRDFHRTLFTGSGNSVFSEPAMLTIFIVGFNLEREFYNELAFIVQFSRRHRGVAPENLPLFLDASNRASANKDGRILKAILSGDGERTERLVRNYVVDTVSARMREFEMLDEWDVPVSRLPAVLRQKLMKRIRNLRKQPAHPEPTEVPPA